MGAWGTSIFRDDEACDIRNMFRELIADGKTPTQAEKSLLKSFGVHRSPTKCADFDEWGRFWLFLAAAKHQVGRLDSNTRRLALRYIDAGGDSQMYLTAALQRKRLEKLRAFAKVLNGPQPTPVDVRPQKPIVTHWRLGDVFSYRLNSGTFVLIRVIGRYVAGNDNAAIVEVLRRTRKRLPQRLPKHPQRLNTIHLKHNLRHARSMKFSDKVLDITSRIEFERYKSRVLLQINKSDGKLCLPSEHSRKFQPERWTHLGRAVPAEHADSIGVCFFGDWSNFDRLLKSDFGLT